MAKASLISARLNPQPPYRDWRAATMKALAKLNLPAVPVTREGILTRAYIQGPSPEQAAEVASRYYDTTHPPAWLKRRR